MATTYTSPSGSSWNQDIALTLAQKQAANPNIKYVYDYDANGQLHYAQNQKALDKIIAAVPKGATTYTRDAQYGGQSYTVQSDSQKQIDSLQSQNSYLRDKLDNYYEQLKSMTSPQVQQQNYEKAQKASDEQINNMYDKSARDYYVLYKKQMAALPTQLSRVGATGGASETSQLALLNNYGTNIANNEINRNNNLSSSAISANEKKAQASQDAASQMANYYYNMAMQQYQNEKDAEDKKAEESAANQTSAWNAQIANSINEQLTKGNTVYAWYDNENKRHWTTSKDKAMASGYSYDILQNDNRNSNVAKRIEEQLAKGNTVYSWYDNENNRHWTTSKNTAMASGYSYETLKPNTASSTKSKTSSTESEPLTTSELNKIVSDIQGYGYRNVAGYEQGVLNAVNAYSDRITDKDVDYIRKQLGLTKL